MGKQKAFIYEGARKYCFLFESDLHPDLVRWRYTDEAIHAANAHKTFKPKLSDLVIETKLDSKLKTQIRRELLEDILKEGEV